MWEGGSRKRFVYILVFSVIYIWSVTVQVLYISVDFEEQIYICILVDYEFTEEGSPGFTDRRQAR